METIQERIKKIIIEFYMGKQMDFCIESDLNNRTLANVLGHRNTDPSSDFIAKVIGNKKLNISPDWLLLGTGEMKRQDHLLIAQLNSSNFPNQNSKDMVLKDEIITQMRARILLLEEKISILKHDSVELK